MKRAWLLGVGLALASAAPAAAADQEIFSSESDPAAPTWDKPNVAVDVGERVTWKFTGAAQAHNVVSDGADVQDAEWALFKPRAALPAPPESFVFKTPGKYKFLCELHSGTMFGTVTVGQGPVVEVIPPPSQQPLTNDVSAPVTVEKVSEDKAKPKLSSVSAKRVARGALRVRFRANEQSVVQVRLKRAGRTVKTVETDVDGLRGMTVRGLRAGRYTAEVRATDLAGNRSSLKRARITVR